MSSTDFARTLTSIFKPGAAQPAPVGDTTIAGARIGRYKTVSRIGDGAMGAVYAAYDPVLSRTIALKTLNLDLPPDERARFEASFLDEARAVAKLNHPNIVTVYDAGKSPQGPYIAMELLEGEELRSMLARGERLTPNRAAEVASRVAEALSYAHANGIVHRDVKPGNIFMVTKNQPKVLDFGIAQVARKPVTSGGADTVLGSPTYMAPECVRGESVDGRSDIWSLGVVLYELLTGRTPFTGQSLQQLLNSILVDAPQPPHVLNPAVPLELARISARALAKRPEDRYQSAKDMSDDLKRWIAASRVKRLMEESGAATAPVKVAKSPRARRRLAILAFGVMASVALLLYQQFVGFGAARDQAQPPPAHAAAPVAPAVHAAPPVTAPPVESVPVAPVPELTPAPVAAAPVAPPAPASNAPVEAIATAPVAPAQSNAAQLRAQKAERDRKLAAERAAAAAAALAQRNAQQPAAPAAIGQVLLAVSPWGEVFVDGASKGISPPLTSLNLPVGKHTIEVRNGDAPPYVTSVQVEPDTAVRVRYRFGG